ncbi:hypothetical protein BDN72DRAFT_877603 [Pluteus cervinus]|uniref:Uncharacterized protein n=1 Tax=Pluteus cervinus TaxID=181527 RepID=A0ACD3AZM4_9AGAR|nr:hypothetical protein BDN72DRAFT_877603 [Pluteus cervinus]
MYPSSVPQPARSAKSSGAGSFIPAAPAPVPSSSAYANAYPQQYYQLPPGAAPSSVVSFPNHVPLSGGAPGAPYMGTVQLPVAGSPQYPTTPLSISQLLSTPSQWDMRCPVDKYPVPKELAFNMPISGAQLKIHIWTAAGVYSSEFLVQNRYTSGIVIRDVFEAIHRHLDKDLPQGMTLSSHELQKGIAKAVDERSNNPLFCSPSKSVKRIDLCTSFTFPGLVSNSQGGWDLFIPSRTR